jgi:elongation factor Ts
MSLSLVKELREKTGAGLLDCQKALGEANGDPEKALRLLREKGLAKAARKASRVAADGMVGSYIHPGAKIGVLIEVNCETDFVAKTDEFQTLVRDLAMQVAAASPRWVRREDVPESEFESERAIYRVQAEQSGKPAQVIERIVAGQVDRYLKDVCLLEQAFIKQSDRTVKDVVQEAIARLGENVTVRRFARFQLGESQERRAQEDKSAETKPADQDQVDKETPAGGAPGA